MGDIVYYDMTVRQGETFSETIWLVDQDGKPISLANKTPRAQVRPTPKSNVLTANMTCTKRESNGQITFAIDASKTKTIPVGTYAYDVCTYEDINEKRIVKYYIGGKFRVLPSVTDVLT
ncbi:MAG: hypothetical protein J6W04_00120 [Bacteroidales bacterium]|nr:hypothetical protein [Bacteroidales bacterium]